MEPSVKGKKKKRKKRGALPDRLGSIIRECATKVAQVFTFYAICTLRTIVAFAICQHVLLHCGNGNLLRSGVIAKVSLRICYRIFAPLTFPQYIPYRL